MRIRGIGFVALMMLSATVAGQTPVTGTGANCYYGVEGICIPSRASFGFHAARWRPWPLSPQPEKKETPADIRALPEAMPEPIEEGDSTPSSPGKPRDTFSGDIPPLTPDEESVEPPAQDVLENPFQDDPLLEDFDDLGLPQAGIEGLRATPPFGGEAAARPKAIHGPKLLRQAQVAPRTLNHDLPGGRLEDRVIQRVSAQLTVEGATKRLGSRTRINSPMSLVDAGANPFREAVRVPTSQPTSDRRSVTSQPVSQQPIVPHQVSRATARPFNPLR
jgi:hypothetical protein